MENSLYAHVYSFVLIDDNKYKEPNYALEMSQLLTLHKNLNFLLYRLSDQSYWVG